MSKPTRKTTAPAKANTNTKRVATIADLREDPNNPREITAKALAGLGFSQEEFGDLSGVTYNTKLGALVSGHQRVKALKAKHGEDLAIAHDATNKDRGWIIIPGAEPFAVRFVSWDKAKHRAANIAANTPTIAGTFSDALQPQLAEIMDDSGTLYKALGLEDLAASLRPKEGPKRDEDTVPAVPKKATARHGDLFILGDHRLICGDATDAATIKRLMDGERAALVFTDPPYGVSYAAPSGKHAVIKGDGKRSDDLIKSLLLPALRNAVQHAAKEAAFYIWHASSTRADFDFALRAAGLAELQYLIWAKPSIVLGHAHYQWSHEPCYYAARAGESPKFYGDRSNPSVWRIGFNRASEMAAVIGPGISVSDGKGNLILVTTKIPKGKKVRSIRIEDGQTAVLEHDGGQGTLWEIGRDTGMSPEHPTQKPVELAARGIQNSSKTGEVVLDLFLGSGTTLIAAEATGRRCFGTELDPKYADVIVARWEAMTGRKAVVHHAATLKKAK